MKRTLGLLLTIWVVSLINAAALFYFFGGARTANAGPPAPCTSCDVNGDGVVDVSDPIALLSYIFEGTPTACAQAPQLTPDEIVLLQEILPHLSVVYLDDGQGGTAETIRFTGVNVQIVNGLGATNGNTSDPFSYSVGLTNGLGNLIIGYNEASDLSAYPNNRTGSHNIIVGTANQYSSWGGFVAGRYNTVSGPWASVSGGQQNTASARYSSVSGGDNNQATAVESSVSGGAFNVASAQNATASGGEGNEAQGEWSTVSGGHNRTAAGQYDWVAGSAMEDF